MPARMGGGYRYGIIEDVVPDMFGGDLCIVAIKSLKETRTYKPEALKEIKNISKTIKTCKKTTQVKR